MPVFDQTFRRYTGPRLPAHSLWWPVARATLRPVLRAKLAGLLAAVVMLQVVVYSVLMYVGANAGDLLARTAPRVAERAAAATERGMVALVGRTVTLPTLLMEVLGAQLMATWLLVLATGGGSIAGDRRHQGLPLLFARPLRPRQYLAGKTAGLAMAPAAVLATGAVLVWAQAIGYFEESADIVTRLPLLAAALAWSLGAGLFIAVIMVACSALCRKPAEAAVLFLVFQAVTFVAARLAGRREGLEAALYLSPRLDMQAAGQWMLGARPDFSTRGPIGAAMERMDGRLAICALAAYAIVALLAARGSLRVVETVK